MINEEEYQKRLKWFWEEYNKPKDISQAPIVSDKPKIQSIYARWWAGNLTDNEWLQLLAEAEDYIRTEATEEDDKAFSEFMESLVMLCDAIKEGL